MANQTVTTVVNHDDAAVSGLLNGETYTINGGEVRVNGDVRWGQNAAVIGNVTISATLGGKFVLDGRDVWEIPYIGATGNVPAIGALGTNTVTQGGASGELMRVWANGEMEPRAPGTAMPAAGWIKMRSKTGAFVAGTVTLPGGATIEARDGGKRSWIHVVGARTTTITVPRLGSFEVLGDWYELGVTTADDSQVFSLPVAEECPAIQIETAPGSGVFEWWLSAGERWPGFNAAVTTDFIPTDARGRYFGQILRRTDAATTSGSPLVTVGDTFGMVAGAPAVLSAGFVDNDNLYIVSVNSGTQITVSANSNITGTARTISTPRNLVQIAHRGTRNVGLKPPAGCRVRIPNVIISTSSSPWAGNVSETMGGDRWDLTTTASGAIIMDKAWCNIWASTTAAYSVNLTNSAFLADLTASNTATAPVIENCAVGIRMAEARTVCTFTNQFTGLVLRDLRFARFAMAATGDTGMLIQDCANVEMTRLEAESFGSTTAIIRGGAGVNVQLARVFDFEMTDCKLVGSRVAIGLCVGGVISNLRYADLLAGATVATQPVSAIEISAASSGIDVAGFANYADLANVHPYNAIVATATGSQNITVRDIGTAAAPYNMGSANACGAIVNAAVTLGLTMRRLYAQNTRASPVILGNTVQNVVADNIWGDYADAQAIAAVNLTARGCRWTPSVTGQSAVYGHHWVDAFISGTAGRIQIACNEPLAATATQAVITGGNPRYTSGGQVAMPAIGDQVTWEMPYFALGHTAFANAAPTLTGTNTGNLTYEFQFDKGAGWNGGWLTLNAANLVAVGAIDPAVGVRLRIRATTTVANTGNALTHIRVDTVTTATDQRTQYPLPGIPLTITGLVAGSEVRAYTGIDPLTAVEIGGVENSGTSFSFEHRNAGEAGYVVVIALGYQNLLVPLTYAAAAQSLSVQQIIDRQYNNP
jgi:hypothetical protein